MHARDDDYALTSAPIEKAIRKPFQEYTTYIAMDDRVGVRKGEDGFDRAIDLS